jgi:two-component system, LytTR family, response regulator
MINSAHLKEQITDPERIPNRPNSIVSKHKAHSLKQWIVSTLEELRKNSPHRKRLAIKTQGKILFLNQEEIHWIEAHGNYVELNTIGGNFISRISISTLETMLDPAEFVRIHRSIIVNLFQIRELKPHAGGECRVVLANGKELTMSRSYRHKLRQITGLSAEIETAE